MVDQRLTSCLPHTRFQPGRSRARPAGFSVQGFTLIELMVVVALVAILLGLGVPGFRELITATRIKNASFDVFSSLIHARSEAITRNADVRICPASGTDWASGWTVRIGPTDCSGTTLKTQDRYSNITITGPASLSFNGMGRANALAITSFTIDTPGALDQNKRCVILDPSGRPITKPPVKTGFICP